MVENFAHPDLHWGKFESCRLTSSDNAGSKNVEIDVWIPAHNVGFEYQGEVAI